MNGDIVALSFLLTLVSIVAADGTNYCKFDRKECNCIADNGWGVDLRNISHPIKSSDTGEAVYVSFCEDSDVTPNYINGTNSCHSQKYSVGLDNISRSIWKISFSLICIFRFATSLEMIRLTTRPIKQQPHSTQKWCSVIRAGPM